MTTLEDYVKNVEEVAPHPDVLKAAVTYFTKVKITAPSQLAGLVPEDLGNMPEEILVRGLIRRAVIAASVAQKMAAATPASQSTTATVTTPAMSQQLALAGNETSALAVAASLTGVQATPRDLLKVKNLDGLAHGLVPDVALFNLLSSEKKVAQIATRAAFLYVDLTAKEVLPVWLTAESVGGKAPGVEGTSATNTVEALGAALRAASSTARSFKSFPQWLAACTRYGAAAIACDNITMCMFLAYQSVIARIAEDQRVRGKPIQLAFIYDELFRRSIAQRLRQGEVVDMEKAFAKTDEETLEIAKSRFESTLEAASFDRAGAPMSEFDATQSALSKQMAAADALRSKAERAAKELARAQDAVAARDGAGSASSAGGLPRPPPAPKGGGGKGGKGGGGRGSSVDLRSNKKRKSDEWIERQRAGRKRY